jgi:DNA-directed RNA polymerase specialized sigma24 family protein
LFEADAEQANVRAMLAGIDRSQSQVLLLWAEDLTYREIAAAADVNFTSVGSQYERRYGKK